jgi:hypothetical protein
MCIQFIASDLSLHACHLVQNNPKQRATMLTVCLLPGNGQPTHLYAEDALSSSEQSQNLMPSC